MHTDDQMQDSGRSGMTTDISYVEGAVPPDMLLKFPEEDLENLRRLLYLDKRFPHGSNPPDEVLFQAIEAYENEEAKLRQDFCGLFHFHTKSRQRRGLLSIEDTSATRLSEAPKEGALIQGTQFCCCFWVDKRTKQICQKSVPTRKKPCSLT
ncbi:hypothetical protein AZE42_02500 [Rhizopogon vesiculosus]|uniref:Uncharacterized protein n=1 Tax=Rhizopogon vesiculosus TaxID=180088 RepID=A0A1J8QJM0_9AGAM|nr:hypothetical protein AZE42_02500 [Rhizopogon vesiculosus]